MNSRVEHRVRPDPDPNGPDDRFGHLLSIVNLDLFETGSARTESSNSGQSGLDLF